MAPPPPPHPRDEFPTFEGPGQNPSPDSLPTVHPPYPGTAQTRPGVPAPVLPHQPAPAAPPQPAPAPLPPASWSRPATAHAVPGYAPPVTAPGLPSGLGSAGLATAPGTLPAPPRNPYQQTSSQAPAPPPGSVPPVALPASPSAPIYQPHEYIQPIRAVGSELEISSTVDVRKGGVVPKIPPTNPATESTIDIDSTLDAGDGRTAGFAAPLRVVAPPTLPLDAAGTTDYRGHSAFPPAAPPAATPRTAYEAITGIAPSAAPPSSSYAAAPPPPPPPPPPTAAPPAPARAGVHRVSTSKSAPAAEPSPFEQVRHLGGPNETLDAPRPPKPEITQVGDYPPPPQQPVVPVVAHAAGDSIPVVRGYRLIEPLGRGTFGSVWRAVNNRTGAEGALKLFDHQIGADWELLRREVECLLRVGKHPNVVTMLDADFAHQPPFYVMELMASSLEAELKAVKQAAIAAAPPGAELEWYPWPDIPRAVRYMEEIARGLLYVHGKAFLHCDLKPANILLDEEGRVRIVDFGQALLRGRDKLSMGTMFFMPPEQTDVEHEDQLQPDVRWDIYALGATIYMVLTGRPPRSGKDALRSISTAGTMYDKLRVYRDTVAHAPLVPLHKILPDIPKDLEAIVHKCLEIDTSRRYGNITEVLEDIDRMRTYRPLIARQPWPKPYLAQRYIRRNALWLIPVVALFIVETIQLVNLQRKALKQNISIVTMMNRDGSETTTGRYTDEKGGAAMDNALADVYLVTIQKARSAIARGDAKATEDALSSILPEQRSFDWGHLKFLSTRMTGTVPPDPMTGIEKVNGLPRTSGSLAITPNGFTFVINNNLGGGAEAIDSKSNKPIAALTDNGKAWYALAIAADGKTAVAARVDGSLHMRSGPTFDKFKPFATLPGTRALIFTPDSKRIIAIDAKGTVTILLNPTGRVVYTIDTGFPDASGLFFSPESNKLVATDGNGNAVLVQASRWGVQ